MAVLSGKQIAGSFSMRSFYSEDMAELMLRLDARFAVSNCCVMDDCETDIEGVRSRLLVRACSSDTSTVEK
jgi:hypothetical protein